MSPRPSRTVTGVIYQGDLHFDLGLRVPGRLLHLGAGFGCNRPRRACARAGASARARRSVRVREAPAIRIIRIAWYHRTLAGAQFSATRAGLKPYTTLYLIRRMSSGRRCRKPLRFLQSRFASSGEKTDVRRQRTAAPACAESAA